MIVELNIYYEDKSKKQQRVVFIEIISTF